MPHAVKRYAGSERSDCLSVDGLLASDFMTQRQVANTKRRCHPHDSCQTLVARRNTHMMTYKVYIGYILVIMIVVMGISSNSLAHELIGTVKTKSGEPIA